MKTIIATTALILAAASASADISHFVNDQAMGAYTNTPEASTNVVSPDGSVYNEGDFVSTVAESFIEEGFGLEAVFDGNNDTSGQVGYVLNSTASEIQADDIFTRN